jgi:hypothetical protein
MADSSDFLQRVAEGVQLFKDGELEEAREEFAVNRRMCEKKAKAGENQEYWERMDEAMQVMIEMVDRKILGLPLDSFVSENRVGFGTGLRENIENKSSEGVQYKDGVGQEEIEVASDSTEAVLRSRIDFLEGEVGGSEETVMELKQELDQLKDEEE